MLNEPVNDIALRAATLVKKIVQEAPVTDPNDPRLDELARLIDEGFAMPGFVSALELECSGDGYELDHKTLARALIASLKAQSKRPSGTGEKQPNDDR